MNSINTNYRQEKELDLSRHTSPMTLLSHRKRFETILVGPLPKL